MGYDSNGNYTRTHNFSADSSAAIKILASRMDAELDDFASAMSIVLLRGGQVAPTANQPMGGFKHTNVGAATSTTNYLRAQEYITQIPIMTFDDGNSTVEVSVSVDFYVTSSANADPPNGAKLIAISSVDKTLASAFLTLQTPAGTNSSPIYIAGVGAAPAGQIKGGAIHEYVFNSAQAAWQLMNPYRGVRAITGNWKGKNAAGTVTGADTGNPETCYANVDGDIVTLAFAGNTVASVSVSISTAYFVWSAETLAQMLPYVGSTINTFAPIMVVRNSGNTVIPLSMVLAAAGSVEVYESRTEGPVAAPVLSADETFQIMAGTHVLIHRR